MSKRSIEQLKKDEFKILEELQKNAKENIDTIAKHCGFSRQKVWRTMKQLEKHQVIWGYSAITNQETYNKKQFMIFIKRTYKPLDKKIIDKIDSINLEDIALPHGVIIESSCYVHGNYDWIISFIAQDLNQAKVFCDALYTRFPGAIEQIDLQQILYCVRKNYIFNPDRKKLHDLME